MSQSNRKTLGLTGREQFRLRELSKGIRLNGTIIFDIMREEGQIDTTEVNVLLETENEVRILRAGGLLPVLVEELTMAS